MTTKKFIPYAHHSIDAEDIKQVNDVLTSGVITRGPYVESFENGIAEYCGARYAVAFNNGSSALQAAYYAAEITKYDTLITSPNTFAATATMAIRSGGPSPTFVDIDETTGNIDLDALAEKLMIPSSRGKNIVVPVHFAGLPVDMERLGNMPLSPDDIIIEDGSHALGSSYEKNGPLVGSCVYSDMTVFSFHPAKTITTGEGGMVTTNNEAMAQRLRLFRNNGIVRDCPDSPGPWYHEVVDATGNYNMTDISAALGVSQLKKIDLFIKKRRKITSWYHEDLEGVKNLSFLEIPQENTVSPHLFVVKIDFEACKTTRKAVMERLHDEGIGSQVLYIPLYQQPYFKNILGDISTDFPNMERYYSQTLALPLHCNIERSDVSRISSTIKKILNAN